MDLVLSENQFDLVYDSFSFVIACMGASFVFFLLVRSKVAPRHRMAVTLSTLVVAIALYHYVRIFDSFSSAFDFVGGEYVQTGAPFNEGYRYVDWLLTVPLLLAELVVVLELDKSTTRSLLVRLTTATRRPPRSYAKSATRSAMSWRSRCSACWCWRSPSPSLVRTATSPPWTRAPS